ncbi:uncharacterized protein PGRI_014920 [Penicillium griseofulvum]|uniref:Uncharacterized protein n=1 Tax=Penicillium patulum TaxID=5078 RepID=A0A135LF72_PENPA|nr:uncharacterized protein PGRI_014920 [Penicillium griseofulvum]KXG47622.1 hypothetical protein PGRI_014920 [Penicillium griseofulvum]
MSFPKRTIEGLEQSKAKRVCRPAPLNLKRPMPTHLANGDNLSPFLVEEGQSSPIPAKLFSNVLKINEQVKNESSKATPTPFADGDHLSPRLIQDNGQPSPISHTLFNESLNITEPSEATPPQGPFPFSGAKENTQQIEFNPRLSTPKKEASDIVNVNWPLPYTRKVGPVNEDGYAVVTQTWYDYSSMKFDDSSTDSSGSPRPFNFDPRSFPAPRVRTRVQYFGRPDGTPRKKPRFIMGFHKSCPHCRSGVPGHSRHLIFR